MIEVKIYARRRRVLTADPPATQRLQMDTETHSEIHEIDDGSCNLDALLAPYINGSGWDYVEFKLTQMKEDRSDD